MEEVGTGVTVKGGNVMGGDVVDVDEWFEWIGELL
jgi:signal recognition particle receptor subunit beta